MVDIHYPAKTMADGFPTARRDNRRTYIVAVVVTIENRWMELRGWSCKPTNYDTTLHKVTLRSQ